MKRYQYNEKIDGCLFCGAPMNAHGPRGECDEDAVAARAHFLFQPDMKEERAANESPGRKTRAAIVVAVIGAIVTVAAGAASCVNSGIGYRQMRALETIADRCTGSHAP